MDKIIRSKLIRKALALVLTLVVGLTFIPLLGSSAYAADEDLTGDIADAILDQAEGANEEEIDVALDGPAAKKAHVIDITDPGDLEVVTDDAKNTLTDESEWNFTVSKSGSTLTINASFKKGLDKSPYGCTFGGVYIDDSLVASFDVSKLTNYRIGLSGSQLNPGYHNVELAVYARFNGGSRQYLDVTKLKDKAKEFILNENDDPNLPEKVPMEVEYFGNVMVTKDHVISLQNDRGTSYSKYIEVQNELVAAYNELRNDLSQKKWAKNYDELDEDQQKAVQKILPQKISEAEPKNYGGKK